MRHKDIPSFHTRLIWVVLWTSMLITFSFTLPGFSEFDAFKYVNIAQGMMDKHHYLLAYWEKNLYSDKPPLFFWLMIAGWKLFGMADWWPQLIVLILATLSIFLSQELAKTLWPDDVYCQRITPFILIGCFYWVWFAKEVRVDAILVFATLLSLYSIVCVIQEKSHYWLLYIFGIGLGAFAKGPVILVFILLPSLFLPTLLKKDNLPSPKWYALLGLATIIGLSLPLCWAIPAAMIGGKVFMHDIFYEQIAHRAHQQRESIGFYLLHLPLWLLPWTLFAPVWRNLGKIQWKKKPQGEFACLIIIASGLVVFSIFGQKLPHYIYPLFPIFALLMARTIAHCDKFNDRDHWPMTGLILLFAVCCLLYSTISPFFNDALFIRGYFLQEIHLKLWGLLFAATAFFGMLLKIKTQWHQIIFITTLSSIMTLFFNNVVLAQYQQHLKTTTMVWQQIKNIHPKQLAVVTHSTIENPPLESYLNTQHIPHIQPQQLREWQTTHPNAWILTTRIDDLKKRQPYAWCYQTRLTILALLKPENQRVVLP